MKKNIDFFKQTKTTTKMKTRIAKAVLKSRKNEDPKRERGKKASRKEKKEKTEKRRRKKKNEL